MTDELPPPDFTLDGGDSHCYYAATVRAAIAAAVSREREAFAQHAIAVTRNAMANAAARERELCAQVCDARDMGDGSREDQEARRCAAAIRGRG